MEGNFGFDPFFGMNQSASGWGQQPAPPTFMATPAPVWQTPAQPPAAQPTVNPANVAAPIPGQNLSSDITTALAQQTPSASGWDGGGMAFGGSTVAPVSGIQTSESGGITNLGPQGYVSQNNAQSQIDNTYDPNTVANLYGQDGTFQQSFTPEDPYKQDPMELAILAAIAAGGVATFAGLGGAGAAGGAGSGSGAAAAGGAGAADAAISAAAGSAAAGAGELTAAQVGQMIAAEQAAAGVGGAAASSGGGILGGLKAALAKGTGFMGLSPTQALSLGSAVLGSVGGSDTPSYGGSSSGGSVASSQGQEAKNFLEQVLPSIRHNSTNPSGSATWVRGADGSWNLNTELNGPNKNLYDQASWKLDGFLQNLDPSQQAPDLLDSAGYSEQLAKTIYDRTMGTQANTIDAERRAMQARLVEQGFSPQNEGYTREMNRWEDNLGEARQKAAMDAQIRAATQGLDEAKFTNASRNQEFQNSQSLQQQIASLLTGIRSNVTEPLKGLTSSSSAPSGGPANTVAAAQNQYTADMGKAASDNAARNDMIRALLQWGLA